MAFDKSAYDREYYRKNQGKRKVQIAKAAKLLEKRSETDIDLFAKLMTRRSSRSAKKRGIPFKLTKEDVKNLLVESKGRCAESGLKLSVKTNCNMKASIDRIDSRKGYVKGNVQIVATIVNLSKNTLSDKDYLTLCKAVLKNNGYTVTR